MKQSITAASQLITAGELAAILCVSTATVRRHAKDLGGIQPPGFRKWLFARERVDSLLWASNSTAGDDTR